MLTPKPALHLLPVLLLLLFLGVFLCGCGGRSVQSDAALDAPPQTAGQSLRTGAAEQPARHAGQQSGHVSTDMRPDVLSQQQAGVTQGAAQAATAGATGVSGASGAAAASLPDAAQSGQLSQQQSEQLAAQQQQEHAPQGQPLSYQAAFVAPKAPQVAEALRASSLLEKLKDAPPEDMAGLEFRLTRDEAEALRLLHAYGFYLGTVQRHVDAAARPVRVVLELAPGPLFTVDESPIYYKDAQGVALPLAAPDAVPGASAAGGDSPSQASAAAPALPRTLAQAGLRVGAPAVAGDVLDAVDGVPELLRERGYPLARVVSTRYMVDKAAHTLCAAVVVDAGPRARMGEVRVQGESRVSPEYLQRLQTWDTGRLWDQREVENYRDLLTRQGLFRSLQVEAVPRGQQGAPGETPSSASGGASSAVAPASGPALPSSSAASATGSSSASALPALASPGGNGREVSVTPLYDILLSVADAPQRTVGGGLRYESDRGPGVQAYWEDRNWLSNGELLRAEGSVWQDMQTARLLLRKPAFLQRNQMFTAETWMRNEDTDAYSMRAAWAGASVERRFARRWAVSAGLSAEGGDLKDPIHARQGYTMGGIPLSLRYEGAGNPLNPEHGVRGGLSIRPLMGYYGEAFTVLPVRMDVSGYLPVMDMAEGGKRVVLAARAAGGSLLRDDAQKIPASARWYGGGGGSVRGYAYQSLGPRRNGDPLGGASFLETSLEARIRVAKDIAVVPFIDGGNIYPDATPNLARDGLQWGAGLGLRYYTAIGPLRLDVATPLNPRKDDGLFFLYISIGQSF